MTINNTMIDLSALTPEQLAEIKSILAIDVNTTAIATNTASVSALTQQITALSALVENMIYKASVGSYITADWGYVGDVFSTTLVDPIQWYRKNPVSGALTPIADQISSSYIATSEDIGSIIVVRGFNGTTYTQATHVRTTVATLPELQATSASQPIKAAYSLRKVVSTYSGSAVRVLDSGGFQHDVGFDAQGNLDLSGFSGWGDGATFKLHTWYDQSGNANHAPSNGVNYPLFKFEGPGLTKPYVDHTTRYMACQTTATPLNLGGTNNLSIMVVFNSRGWSSSGTHSRDPAVHGGIYGPVVGYGTAYSNALVTGARGANAETTLYAKEGELLVDANTDFSASRWRNVWFNQKGAVVSGGGDTRRMFKDRAHGVADYPNSKITLGNHGGMGNSHNGGIREVIVYNPTTALSDVECQRVAMWQRSYWTGLADNRYPDRYAVAFAGQSNAEYYGRDSTSGGALAASGDGTVNSNAFYRVFTPAVKTAISIPTNTLREFTGLCTTTAFGGSSVVKRAQGANGYWWDQDTGTDGTRLTSWKTGISAVLGYKYRKWVIMWSQGEAEASFLTANAGDSTLVADWKAQTKLVWAAMRAYIGYDCPIVIQPLGNYGGNQTAMNTLRGIQTQLAAEVPGVTISAETTDLVMFDSVHFAPFTQSPNGYDLGATRLASVIGPKLLTVAARP